MLAHITTAGLLILCFDAAASLAARHFKFAYAKATVGSYALFTLIGFVAARAEGSTERAVLVASAAGLIEASAGCQPAPACSAPSAPRSRPT